MGENNINNDRVQCHAIMAENQNNVTRKTNVTISKKRVD